MLAFPNLSVAANIFAGRELTNRFGRLRKRAMRERAASLLARLHVPVSPDAQVDALPVAYRQLLQVARALAFDCRILALDEPTTALTDAETDHLFRILTDLQQHGVTLIYVSHRLPEVFRLCQRITVLRDGCHVATFDRSDVNADQIVQAMVGRSIPARATDAPRTAAGLPRLRLRDLTSPPCFEQLSVDVRAGEILGLFGLVGSGRTELLEAIVGLRRTVRGEIRVDDVTHQFDAPREAARAGVVLVPEDRQRQGLFANLTLRHNLILPSAEASRAWIVRPGEREVARALLSTWRIRATSIDVEPASLSGGNQQKVVLAKWLALDPRVLLLDEPTKGVDVGAKFEIHGIIRELASRGAACLVVSSDLAEILALADRILVMREGRIRGELPGPEANEEQIMRLATEAPDSRTRRPRRGGSPEAA
jgi:ABC-type sugar transport system ATPase subunit